MPHGDELGRSEFRSQRLYWFSAVRRSRHYGLRAVPRERAICGHSARLRLLPPRRLPEDHQSQSRGRRLSAGLFDLPQHSDMAGSEVRPCQNSVSPDRGAPPARLHEVPREWHLQRPQHGLRLMPFDQLQQHHESGSQGRRISAGMPGVSQHHRLDSRQL